MYLIRFSFWSLFFFISIPLSAQPLKNIRILDRSTLLPLPGVVVFDGQKSTLSNQAGWVELATSSAELSFSLTGYKSLRIPFTSLKDTLSLEPMDYLQEVVVVGLRGGGYMSTSQKTLSKTEIEDQYYGQDVTELLQNTPGVYSNFQSGVPFTNYSEIRLRGMDQSRINITLDGVPLNDALDQGVFFSNFTDFGNSIESIQVQRGVGTSSTGTASYAGSINFESISLRDTAASASIQSGAGSFQTRRFSAEASTGLKANGLSAYVRYSELATDGYRYHSGTRATSFFGSAGYYGKKDLLKVVAFSGRTKNQLAYLPEPISLINADRKVNSLSRNMTDDFGQSLFSLQYHRFLGRAHTLAATLFHGWAGGDFEVSDDLNFSLQNNHSGVLMNYHFQPVSVFTLDAGVQAQQFKRENYAFLSPLNTQRLYTNFGLKQELSAFLKMGYRLGKLTAFADLQVRNVAFDYTADAQYQLEVPAIQWQFINPKAGLSYELNPKSQIWISLGRSGREPTRRDLLVGLDDITPANADTAANFKSIKAEQVTDLELGYRFQGPKLSLDFNVYRMEFRNEIAPTGEFTSWGELLRKNVPESRREGIELGLVWKPLKWFKLSHTSALTRARIKVYENSSQDLVFSNVQPLLSPQVILQEQVELDYPGRGQLILTTRYVSRSYLSNENVDGFYLPSYLVMNAMARLNLYKNHKISFMVNNLLNARYFTSGTVNGIFSPEAEAAYFVAAPRNYMITLHLSF